MELIFTDVDGDSEVLAISDDIMYLKNIASNKYNGDEMITWASIPSGKPYSEQAPEYPCSCSFDDGSSFTIS